MKRYEPPTPRLAIGIAAGPVIASIHEKRDEFRAELSQAIGDRDEPPRAIRSKLSSRRIG